MLYIGVARRGSLLSAAQREDRPLRTLATGAAALLIAAIVGVLALTGASAQEPPYEATPEGLAKATAALVRAADLADVDQGNTDVNRTDGLITIGETSKPASLASAEEWLSWQQGRAEKGELTGSDQTALDAVQAAKDARDATKRACEAAFGVCEWANPAPNEQEPVQVRVRVVRSDVSSWSVRIEEIGPRGGVYSPDTMTLVTVDPTDYRARVIDETAYTLSNGSRVAVVVDLQRNKRVEFFVARDPNRDGKYRDAVPYRPDQRFAPANTRYMMPLLSSTVDIPYTATEWWLAEREGGS